jgi:PBP1b-binding outer membrane lipoprotein LpoB
VDLKKFLEKIQKIYIWIVAVTLKMTSCKTMSKKKVKKSENPKFYGQNKLLS